MVERSAIRHDALPDRRPLDHLGVRRRLRIRAAVREGRPGGLARAHRLPRAALHGARRLRRADAGCKDAHGEGPLRASELARPAPAPGDVRHRRAACPARRAPGRPQDGRARLGPAPGGVRRRRRRAPRAARGPPGRTLRRRGRGAGRRRGRRARRHQRQLPGRFGEQAPGGREHDGDDGRPRHGPRDHGGFPADADGGRRGGRAGRRGRELQLHDGHAGHGDRGGPRPRARGRRLRGGRALHHGRPLVAGGADRAAREAAAARALHAPGGVMIDRIIEYSARNRFLVILLVALASAVGVWSLRTSPLDALPDLSDVQVIVFTDWPGRSPDLVEDQITYLIVTTMIAAPRVKYVRGESMFGYSFVNVVFHDGTDLYWARSRVLEYMQGIAARLPEGVAPRLGPDATGVGWVYEYALVDRSGTHTLADLRSFQDWTLRYWLASVEGVAEVASVGGFVKQYQVEIDPATLLAHRLPLREVIDAIRRSNNEVGGRLVEFSGTEYIVRGRGYVQSIADLEQIAVGSNDRGTPILVRDIGRVHLGPDLRRGLAELDGQGETVGGVVVMRHGQNALRVIDGVKEKLRSIAPSLPPGVEIVPVYDRSTLIERAIDTLRHTLVEELLIVSGVILLFLWHLPSALIPIFTIPIAVLLAFIPMRALGLTANIMSLGGIAVAIGAMVDAAIVVVEQTHKKLERWQAEGRPGDFRDVVIAAVKEVGGPSFFSLLVIAVSFLPIFALEAQEGRLFKPLAFTKNFSIAIAAVLAITLDPAMRLLFTRLEPFTFSPGWVRRVANAALVGTIHGEDTHPVSRPLMRLYHPVVELVLRFRWLTVALAVLVVAATVPVYFRLGSEFMPYLNEGTILYMPTALPGMSVTQARAALQVQDRMLKQFPEVERVFGKAGRAETPTDPAPLSMFETVVTLKPESEWRAGMTWDKLLG